MAAIWTQLRGNPETKVEGRVPGNEAEARLDAHRRDWEATPGQATREGADGYIQLLRNSAEVGILWIERIGVPPDITRGDLKRRSGEPA